MGRSPCCCKAGLNRGAWTALEDKILVAYVKVHGEGKWRNLPKRAGLKRCGKSCRLRWLNYLRPDIKRGNISHDEEELIIRLHNLLGNRWSLIAGRLPGRTDNEIKNYWNTTLRKKVQSQSSSSPSKPRTISKSNEKNPPSLGTQPQVIRTKALRCTKELVLPSLNNNQAMYLTTKNSVDLQTHQNQPVMCQDSDNLMMDFGTNGELCVQSCPDANFMSLAGDDFQVRDSATGDRENNNNLSTKSDNSLLFDEPIFENWMANDCLELNGALDLRSLTSFLDSEEWLSVISDINGRYQVDESSREP